MTFINKVVIITGAATGTGAAIALHFAKLSARLSLFDADQSKLKKTAGKCEKISKTKVFSMNIDLSDEEQAKRCIDDTAKEFGKIDILVNSADIYRPGSIFDENLMRHYDEVMAINLRATVALTECVAPYLVESKGNIINISSVCAVVIADDAIPYCITKKAINHFTRGAALELASKGVRINVIQTGGLDKDICGAQFEKFKNKIPLKYFVKLEEIAELTAFLASDKARSITGVCYCVEAGMNLQGVQNK